ncbi:hypothetical protein N8075_04405, partial [Planktomarina temperata]|nr:hypothetical protein [Planktomarina temperata]
SSFRYDRIESDMDVQERLDWLAKHNASVSPFTPQPYVQLANVLRRQGFAGDATRVLVWRNDKQRMEERDRAIIAMDGTLWRELTGYAHVFRPLLSLPFKWMLGYGHRPEWVLPWIAAILGITIWFAQQIHIHGQFAPTSSVVLTSQDWRWTVSQRSPSTPHRRSGARRWTLGRRPHPGATIQALAPFSMRSIYLSRWMLWGRKKIGRPQPNGAGGAIGATGCAGLCKWPAG